MLIFVYKGNESIIKNLLYYFLERTIIYIVICIFIYITETIIFIYIYIYIYIYNTTVVLLILVFYIIFIVKKFVRWMYI